MSNPFGKSTLPSHWLPEVALLRMVSIVEAYVDVISMHRMDALVSGTDRISRMLLSDFEISSTASWDERHSAFERYHGFGLRSEPHWQQVAAGIEVRNCLAHGLGNLTARQRAKTGIAQKIAVIDVTVASNQMQLSKSTIPKLGEASMAFVRFLDSKVTLT